ncbi:hypothetical protein HGRIS_011487 [Hohenbuehelia grisea]|uniref:Serine/threonine-protein kinase n=1 Tax=Hohenbuehelia grisea TaxID=104357 RepID=A0ABR3JVD9_9AGAR
MSAQAYRMPQPPLGALGSRRPPFGNAITNHPRPTQLQPAAHPQPTKITNPVPASPEKQDKEKTPTAAAPLPRQTAKAIPPTPPKVIVDPNGRVQFHRVGFLGEGGFARVYEVQDRRGNRLACKVVSKGSLKTKKAKTKLWAEIKIHRSLDHPNIVQFQDCFEDNDNVYMTLELCHSGALIDMLRRRRRFTEAESRYFMVQLIGACHYMHTHQVIHRDLKLGNILLDSNMKLRVADFGLAALIENPGERKKTICGTPNYIAPEVLFDTVNGHSFEVDIWSIGIIMYTLLIGKPPFQSREAKEKDVQDIYARIRTNEYEFPADRVISGNAQDLIQQILTLKPEERPTLHEILEHAWFLRGIVPGFIPATAHDSIPDFRHITRTASQHNYTRLRRDAFLDADQTTAIAVPAAAPPNHIGISVPTSSLSKSITSTLAQQEKEFQKAVQPGSPISALLSSARQPLMMSTAANTRESPLLRKLQAAARESPLAASAKARGLARGLQGIQEEDTQVSRQDESRKKMVESQKARIVAQMAPVKEEEEPQPGPRDRVRMSANTRETAMDRENIPPARPASSQTTSILKGKESTKALPKLPASASIPSRHPAPVPAPTAPKLSGFDAATHVLTLAFDARAQGKLFRDPRQDPHLPIPEERVFIVSWVDYCNKYGMGYALTDGSVGVYFNDSTSMVLSPDKHNFDYVTARNQGSVYVRKYYAVDQYPEDLSAKVYLLKHFERYIMDRLYGEYEYTFQDSERTRGMHWVQKYLRMNHVIVFKLSNDVLQFNFYDHSKIILSSHGLMVTYIDKNYDMTRWTLAELMAINIKAKRGATEGLDDDAIRANSRLIEKLKYCKEVLQSIRAASTGDGPGDAPSTAQTARDVGEARQAQQAHKQVAPLAPGTAPFGGSSASAGTSSLGMSARPSKISMR